MTKTWTGSFFLSDNCKYFPIRIVLGSLRIPSSMIFIAVFTCAYCRAAGATPFLVVFRLLKLKVFSDSDLYWQISLQPAWVILSD